MTIVDEQRHLDDIKGNFMLSETEYLAPVILFEKGKIASQIICSNVKEILDQHQYMFDTLWNKAISAQQRIVEIDEGIVSYETKVLEEDEKKTKRFKGYLENSNQLSACTPGSCAAIFKKSRCTMSCSFNCTLANESCVLDVSNSLVL